MNSADMVHLVPNPDDLLNVSIPEQGRLILRLLTLADNPTNELTGPTKSGRLSYHNFFNRDNDFAAPPKYGSKQRAVDEVLMEAWARLAGQGHLAKDPGPGPDWYFVTRAGRAFITAATGPPAPGFSETQFLPSAPQGSERNDSAQDMPRPTVFISYTWESDNQKAWVLAFANRLRNDDAINARLDQLHLRLGDRSPQFMEESVRDSDYVLVICTESYKRKFDARQGGAGYEGHIITAEMVTEKGRGKFIPVLRQGSWDSAMPTALTGIFGVDLRHDSPTEYRKLVEHLKNADEMSPTETRSSAAGTPDSPSQTEDGRYFRERRGLPETQLVKSIWQRPHWRILIQPHQYLPGHFRAPNECEAFVRRHFIIALGNESLPIVAAGTSFYTSTSPACVRGETDYAELPALCEAWALFQSVQFVLNRPLPTDRPSPKEIHYLEILHVVTQAFEFGRRLAVECDIQGRVTYNISLRNVLGHEILVPKRFPSSYCKTDNIEESEAFSPLDGPDAVFERAIALVLRIYPHFGWRDASADDLRRQQQRQRQRL